MGGTANLSINSLQQSYASGALTPEALVQQIFPALKASGPVFTYLEPLESLLAAAAALAAVPASQRGPLWGIPCAVKDNVDVGGMPTTAACPAFEYKPADSAVGVKALQEAGVIIVGKTNMDQFAAGLVGTRSPYGAPATPFDSRFISGGSSSGSGAAVGAGLVTFALGTDTAGSGRVPAGLCGCVGIKGTVGRVSTVGVVPACASLDCLTVFARSVEEGALVFRTMQTGSAGAEDVWRRKPPAHVPTPPSVGFRFAVPRLGPTDWKTPGGPQQAAQSAAEFEAATARLRSLGGVQVDVDLSAFASIASMLYTTAYVAERYSGIRQFLEAPVKGAKGQGGAGAVDALGMVDVTADDRLLLVTRTIIGGSSKYSAVDVYDANAQLARYRATALEVLKQVDLLLVPTALSHYTHQEILSEETTSPPRWSQNANLGRFTNFVNILRMCGVAVPSGLLHLDAEEAVKQAEQGLAEGTCTPEELEAVKTRLQHLKETGDTKVTLPFGVTLLAPGWLDEWVWGIGAAMHRASGFGCGPEGHLTHTNGHSTTHA